LSDHGGGADGADKPVTYGSYLALEELLTLQRPRSAPEHPDELLFIIVHQSSELWFKAILHDIAGLIESFESYESGLALWHVQRLNALMRIVSAQLSSLETLPPQHFAQFRGYLGTSSGSQSIQFRAIEAASGLRDTHAVRAPDERADMPALIREAMERPTLEDLFLRLIEVSGGTLDDLYLGPAPTILFFLAEALLEYEQLFAEWRFKHVQLVERVIGPAAGGTGGTLGSRHLLRTMDQRFFPKLWEVRARLHGAKDPSAASPGETT
jgi:tryptophan 2,3-dioxygenase